MNPGQRSKLMKFWTKIAEFLFFLVWHLSNWLMSVPAWLTLILHFTLGISWWWFIATFIAWVLNAWLKYMLLSFGRWGSKVHEPFKENKNPYSKK